MCVHMYICNIFVYIHVYLCFPPATQKLQVSGRFYVRHPRAPCQNHSIQLLVFGASPQSQGRSMVGVG